MSAHKTRAPLNLEDIARTIVLCWYKDACRQPYAHWFLYYRTARPGERIAIPIYSQEHDAPEGYTKGIAISTAWTPNQATQRIAEAMRSLPILGQED